MNPTPIPTTPARHSTSLPVPAARTARALSSRSLDMHVLLYREPLLHAEMHERQRQAELHNRAARVLAARKWERRAATASRRARLARAAVS